MAGRVVAQAVIGAFEQPAVDEPPLRQRHAFVPAALVESDHTAGGSPPYHQRLFGNDLALQLLSRELVRQPGHVPGILHQQICGHAVTPWENRRFRGNSAVGPCPRQAAYRTGGRRKAQKAMQPQR